MIGKKFECILWGFLIVQSLSHVNCNPTIPPNGDLTNLQSFQSHLSTDPRPRLSSGQQQQILNDVQQHQSRFNFANYNPGLVTFPGQQTPVTTKAVDPTTTFSSLAKYRVDRSKQQFEQSNVPFFQTAQTQYQLPNRHNFATPTINSFNSFPTDLPLLNYRNPDQLNYQTTDLHLRAYLEKQQELALLRKQRDQLILEQQELKKQQELLRLQQLRDSTTTVKPPTSQTLITQTSTRSSLLVPSPTSRKITPEESEIFKKAIETHQKKYMSTTTTTTPAPQKLNATSQRLVQDDIQEIPKDLLALIQEQNPQLLGNDKVKPQIKIIYQTDKTASLVTGTKIKTLEKDQLLKQLKLALVENTDDDSKKNVTTRDLVLPNGRKLQVIQAPNGLASIIPNEGSSQFQTVTQALDFDRNTTTTTVKPAKAILEELTKGVLPPGADFEVLRQKGDGKLEKVDNAPIHNQPEKKVTFVVLEEQPDGSYKVQDVKGNAEKEDGTDIDSIVNKIKKGELKLPPSSKSPDFKSKSTVTKTTTYATTTPIPSTIKPSTIKYVSSTPKHFSETPTGHLSHVTVTPNSAFSTDNYVTSASTPIANIFNSISTFGPTSLKSSTPNFNKFEASILPRNHFIPTMAPVSEIISSTTSPSFVTTFTPHSSSYVHFSPNSAMTTSSVTPRTQATTISAINHASENLIINDNNVQGRNSISNFDNTINKFNRDSIANLLKREGLYAMAKYLRQTGLDNVLNETGPYTIFVPSDKAFKALLIQLGGPEKAEQKFRENPRLLSGLLLHHVIPGAFRVETLQEEMTGVSLAGTQLRVNVYNMHDHEWNDIQVTTINGARIAPNKRDIEIPQGIAHAVDRVMFPLPVGDLMQTLAADREQRFGTFMKILQASGLDDSLTGTKTYTLFAPTDGAFTAVATQNGRPIWTESDGPEAAKVIASKHIMPTTMYSAGMRYYQQKETLRPHFILRVQKNGGRIRVNEAQVVTHNVPATNGVIHALDGVL